MREAVVDDLASIRLRTLVVLPRKPVGRAVNLNKFALGHGRHVHQDILVESVEVLQVVDFQHLAHEGGDVLVDVVDVDDLLRLRSDDLRQVLVDSLVLEVDHAVAVLLEVGSGEQAVVVLQGGLAAVGWVDARRVEVGAGVLVPHHLEEPGPEPGAGPSSGAHHEHGAEIVVDLLDLLPDEVLREVDELVVFLEVDDLVLVRLEVALVELVLQLLEVHLLPDRYRVVPLPLMAHLYLLPVGDDVVVAQRPVVCSSRLVVEDVVRLKVGVHLLVIEDSLEDLGLGVHKNCMCILVGLLPEIVRLVFVVRSQIIPQLDADLVAALAKLHE